MSNLADLLAEDRRRTILNVLNEGGNRAPEGSLKRVLRHIHADHIGQDEVRQCLLFLEQHRLIRVDRLRQEDGELWVAELTETGQSVARGRRHVGVADRDAA